MSWLWIASPLLGRALPAGEPGIARAPEKAAGLVVHTRCERLEATTGERLSLWVTLENRGEAAVSDLRFDPLASRGGAARIEPSTWHISAPVADPRPRRASHTSALTVRLAPGHRAVHRIAIVLPEDREGSVAPTFAYRWRDGDADRLTVAEAPTIAVAQPRGWRWPLWLEALLLPLLVVALPVWLTWLARGWQARNAEAQRAREEWRKTYDKLLHEVHGLTGAYLASASRIRRFEQSFAELLKAAKGSADSEPTSTAFVDLMLVFAADGDIKAWRFLDREAEKQAATCWEVFRRQAEEALGRQDLAHMIRLIGPERRHSRLKEIFEDGTAPLPAPPEAAEDDLEERRSSLFGRSERRRARVRKRARFEDDGRKRWHTLRKRFAGWSENGLVHQIVLLEVLRRLLYLEVNRIQAPLYKKSGVERYPTPEELPTIRELVARAGRLRRVLVRAEALAEPDLRHRCYRLRVDWDEWDTKRRDLEGETRHGRTWQLTRRVLGSRSGTW